MCYYVQAPGIHHGKAAAIAERCKGQIVTYEDAKAAMSDPTKGVIVVMDNGPFEAAGFAYNMDEWDEFTCRNDIRFQEYVILDRDVAERESDFQK